MDIKKLSDMLGLTVEEFMEIVKLFIKTAGNDIEKIRTAVAAGDFSSAGGAAHSLKGAAGNLGFKELSEQAKAVEVNAKENDREEIERNLPALTGQLEAITARIDAED